MQQERFHRSFASLVRLAVDAAQFIVDSLRLRSALFGFHVPGMAEIEMAKFHVQGPEQGAWPIVVGLQRVRLGAEGDRLFVTIEVAHRAAAGREDGGVEFTVAGPVGREQVQQFDGQRGPLGFAVMLAGGECDPGVSRFPVVIGVKGRLEQVAGLQQGRAYVGLPCLRVKPCEILFAQALAGFELLEDRGEPWWQFVTSQWMRYISERFLRA